MHHYVSASPYKARCSPAALPGALRCARCPGTPAAAGQRGSAASGQLCHLWAVRPGRLWAALPLMGSSARPPVGNRGRPSLGGCARLLAWPPLGNSATCRQLSPATSGQLGSATFGQLAPATSGQLGLATCGQLGPATSGQRGSARGSGAGPWQLGSRRWLRPSAALCGTLRLSSSSGPRRMCGRFGLGQFLSSTDNKSHFRLLLIKYNVFHLVPQPRVRKQKI